MCRVQIPRVASFGMRNRSFSSDALTQDRTRHPCSCGDVSSPANKAFHHAATTEETKFLLSHNGVKVYSDANKPRTLSFEMASHGSSRLHVRSMPPAHLQAHGIAHDHGHPPSVSENDALVLDEKDIIMVDEPEEMSSEATVSQHVVFSGESPLLPYLLAALFSIHSLIAGFALGVNSTSNKTAIATAVAIFSHKV
jgi:zinc transporter ZupT